jgi:hypothetical protein
MRVGDTWLRLPVEGKRGPHAVMSAMTPDRDTLARFRYVPWKPGLATTLANLGSFFFRERRTIEIAVSPACELTRDMLLFLTLAAAELDGFFTFPPE